MKPLLIAGFLLFGIFLISLSGCKKASACYHCTVFNNGDDTDICGSVPGNVVNCIKY